MALGSGTGHVPYVPISLCAYQPMCLFAHVPVLLKGR